ncbi:MAG: hypothetical protein ACYCPD_13805 [Acidobacteriaceae bacterium]
MIRYIFRYLTASILCAVMWMGIRGCNGNFAPYRRSADLDSRSFTTASALRSVTSYSHKFLNTPVDVPSQGTAIHYAPAEDLEHIDVQLMRRQPAIIWTSRCTRLPICRSRAPWSMPPTAA